MKLKIVMLGVLIISYLSLKAQSLQGEKAVTHFYNVNLDDGILDLFSSVKIDNKIFEPTNKKVTNEFTANIIDTFYTIASAKLREELGLELLPLSELHSKIKYSRKYPNCPDMVNIKKVLKNASGYQYYADFFVNVYSDFPQNPENLFPEKIKPLYAISFSLYNAKGETVEKIEFSFRSKEVMANEGNQDLTIKGQQLKLNLCKNYSEALNGFSTICKKKLTAQL